MNLIRAVNVSTYHVAMSDTSNDIRPTTESMAHPTDVVAKPKRKSPAPFKNDGVFTLYMHTHVGTNEAPGSGKRYIGLTRKTMEFRWRRGHVNNARMGSEQPFHRAIRKYGEHAFSHEVLEQVVGVEAANAAEVKWIAHYNSADLTVGYNLDAGGTAHNHNEESKRKIGEASRERWANMTPEELVINGLKQSAGIKAAMTPELRQRKRDLWANLSPEEYAVRSKRASDAQIAYHDARGTRAKPYVPKVKAPKPPRGPKLRRLALLAKQWDDRRADYADETLYVSDRAAAYANYEIKTAKENAAYAAQKRNKTAQERLANPIVRTIEQKAASTAKRMTTAAANKAANAAAGILPKPRKVRERRSAELLAITADKQRSTRAANLAAGVPPKPRKASKARGPRTAEQNAHRRSAKEKTAT